MTTAPTIPDAAAEALATPVPAIARVCPNCSGEFFRPSKGPGGHKRFCSDKCRTTWANREKAEGAALITVARIWRQARGSGDVGKAALAEMCSILDTVNERSRTAGRLPLSAKGPLRPYVDDVLADRYIDRARSR